MIRRTITALAALLALTGTAHAQTKSCGTNPNVQVEVFMSQKTGRLLPGQTKALKLRGQLYGNVNFRGSITFSPNGPATSACPLFVSGTNANLNLAAGQPFVVTVTLKAPAQPPKQDGTCALKYTALYTDRNPPCEAGKGNEVDKPFQVRPTPPAPGEPFE